MAHEQAAETLFNVIPPAIAPDFFEDYGLTVSQEQAQSISYGKDEERCQTGWIDAQTWEVILARTLRKKAWH